MNSKVWKPLLVIYVTDGSRSHQHDTGLGVAGVNIDVGWSVCCVWGVGCGIGWDGEGVKCALCSVGCTVCGLKCVEHTV